MSNSNLKGVGFTVLAVVCLVALWFIGTKISYQRGVNEQSTFVVNARDDCAVTMSNGIKSIVQMAQVDQNTKDFLIKTFEAASKNPASPTAKTAQDAYGQFVNGNSQPFMLLMSTLSGTNITATAENVQREINAQNAAMTVCEKALNRSQKELKDLLGMDTSNHVTSFPQNILGLHLAYTDEPNLPDNDNDGRITVLDYRAPVNVQIKNGFNTGDAGETPNLYPVK